MIEDLAATDKVVGCIFNKSLSGSALDDCRRLLADSQLPAPIEVARLDKVVGELFAALERLELDDDTLVVLISDHGEEFGEHGLYGRHTYALHEELLRVPLIVAGPGVPEGIAGFIDGRPMSRLREVRVADNNGEYELHMYPGEGIIDFADMFRRVEGSGFTGHYMNGFGSLDDRVRAREYLVARAAEAGV